MNRYDIVFAGHTAITTIVPFDGPTRIDRVGPLLFCCMAASCLAKKLAVVTKTDKREEELMISLKAADIALFLQSGKSYYNRLVNPNANVDDRQTFFEKRADPFRIEDLPPLEPCLIHLVGVSGDGYEFPLEFMQALKERGFRLSVDFQSFLWQEGDQTEARCLKDIPEKQEILRVNDFVKLDVFEARALTNTDDVQKQAAILENLGSAETMITSANGALVRSKGNSYFAKFTNNNSSGRAGRGDTFSGAYLARRLNHSVEDSVKFATALTSVKMESPGPFKGTLEDVLARMEQV